MIHVESLAITPRPWLTSCVSSKSPQTGHRDTSWVQMQVSHAPYVNHVTLAGFDCHPPKKTHRSIIWGHIWGNTGCCLAVSLNYGIPIPEQMGFCTWKPHMFGWFWNTLYMRFRTPPHCRNHAVEPLTTCCVGGAGQRGGSQLWSAQPDES